MVCDTCTNLPGRSATETTALSIFRIPSWCYCKTRRLPSLLPPLTPTYCRFILLRRRNRPAGRGITTFRTGQPGGRDLGLHGARLAAVRLSFAAVTGCFI